MRPEAAGPAQAPAGDAEQMTRRRRNPSMADPGQPNDTSSGNGSIRHIAGKLFNQLTGTFVTHIPSRGACTRKELAFWGEILQSSQIGAG